MCARCWMVQARAPDMLQAQDHGRREAGQGSGAKPEGEQGADDGDEPHVGGGRPLCLGVLALEVLQRR